jgi:hypothetical protein
MFKSQKSRKNILDVHNVTNVEKLNSKFLIHRATPEMTKLLRFDKF